MLINKRNRLITIGATLTLLAVFVAGCGDKPETTDAKPPVGQAGTGPGTTGGTGESAAKDAPTQPPMEKTE